MRRTKELRAEECGREVSQVDGQETWKLSVIGRIFHDFNSPSPSRKVAGGRKASPVSLCLYNEL